MDQLKKIVYLDLDTGGALFRNLYRDFLKECVNRLEDPKIEQAYHLFTEIAPMWAVAGRTGSPQELQQSSKLLFEDCG